MGPENKVEFTGGTLCFGDHTIDSTDYTDSIIKIINEPMELTGTIDIQFRDLVQLLGFWPAVKYKFDRLVVRVKKHLHITSPSGRY